ncbi:MAG TPA: hypothetical protein VFH90_08155 [Candidatus Limnocylindria bacterium]|nr:hypothetical protein [Candidatus Limnocylindria bacterium]
MDFGTVRLLVDADAVPGEQVLIVSNRMGRRVPIWPSGWSARLDPELRVYDQTGRPILTVREPFQAGGVDRADGTVLICEINGRFVLL